MSTYKEAIDLYVQALNQTPEGISPLSLLGAALYQEGKPNEAVEVLSLAVQEEESAFAYRMLGDVQEAVGSNDAALASYKKAREFDRKDFYTHVSLGNLYWKMNRLSEAVQAYNAALNIKPDAGDILYKKAVCFMGLNDVENARNIYSTLSNLGNVELMNRLTDEFPILTDGIASEAEPSTSISAVPVLTDAPRDEAEEPSAVEEPVETAEPVKPAEPTKAEITSQLKEYKEKLKSSPYDPEMYFEMGVLLNKIDRSKEALQAFSLALKFDSSHAAAMYEKGITLHNVGRDEEAKALSHRLRKDGQEKLSDMLNDLLGITAEEAAPKAVEAPREEQPPEAEPKEQEEKPEAAEIASAPVAEAEQAAAPKDEVIAKAKDALRANPFDSTTYLTMGKAYHEIGKHRDAMTAYNLAIRFTPSLTEAKYHKALLLIDQEKTEDARAVYESIKDNVAEDLKSDLVKRLGIGGSNGKSTGNIPPDIPDTNEDTGTTAAPPPLDEAPEIPAETPPPPPHAEPVLEPINLETELEESKEEIKKNPYDPKAYLRLGMAYEQLGRHADALKGFNLALQFSPDLSVATYHKGLCYLKMGDEEQALQEYTTLRESGHADLAQKLNDAFKHNGDASEAFEAEEEKPEPPPKYGDESNPESVVEACKNVIKQDPYDPEAYLKMGKAYKELEKYPEAINAFGLAVKAGGEAHAADYERGLCHLKLGEEEKALQIYTNLLKEGQKEMAKKLFDQFLTRLK